MSSKKQSARKKSASSSRPSFLRGLLWRLFLGGFIFSLVVGTFYVLNLDSHIRQEFEGKKWALPAHVYARPLELYPGALLTADQLESELKLLGYRPSLEGNRSGSYQRKGNELRIITRPFVFWDGPEEQNLLRVVFAGGSVADIVDLKTNTSRVLVRLDPYRYATFSPSHNEDRILVKRDQLPDRFVKGLFAVEDRHFYEHHGIDFMGLARAMWVNVSRMELAQGGSTLTQQLVKNFFLTQERSISRKAKEAIMASLLEVHYEKDEILEAYVNEVYLAQDGKRAIHGFGLGAQFYFGADLDKLSLTDEALLIGIVKGPSYYDPRRFPDRALKRRNQVLMAMAEEGVISDAELKSALAAPLNVTPKGGGVSRFPAFVELVREQLSRDYRDEDLRSEGLQIFTTLDPLVQMAAERAVQKQLVDIEKRKGLKELQSAVVVTNTGSGEVLAMVGDREPTAAGYNRALTAKRQIGSLVKPAVYLAAFDSRKYTLTTSINDEPVSYSIAGSKDWSPQNYDRKYEGEIPLYRALAESRNVPAVRIGMDVGVEEVVETLKKLGVQEAIQPFPSILLGAVELNLVTVAQMYQTLADGGFYTPLRTIRTVIDQERNVLQSYQLQVEQVFDAAPVFLLNTGMQYVVKEGTARSMSSFIDPSFNVAGKTGTSNDGRDSWFAGFTGNHMAVAWVGRDDNKETNLTGSQGGMRIWGEVMKTAGLLPLDLSPPANIEMVWVDPYGDQRVGPDCGFGMEFPYIEGTAPVEEGNCGGGSEMQPSSIFDLLEGTAQ